VQYWQGQLRGSKYKNLKNKTQDAKSTKGNYLYLLGGFNDWIQGQKFNIKINIPIKENTFEIVREDIVFKNVEEILTLFEDSPSSKKDIIKIIRTYLDDPTQLESGSSYMNSKFYAIMSYFEKNESPLEMKFNSDKFNDQEIKQDSELTLNQFYDMLTVGQPSIMIKSIMMVKFQAGFDSSTLADRFNFESLRQIIDYFGSDNHNSWDLEKCPVPLKHVRMKNGFQHVPMLDRDAIYCIQKYLDWRISKYGQFDASDPLYLNKLKKPITSGWISDRFSDLAVKAGIQEKISKKQYKIRSHEVRDLLKSTLIECGCREYVADHVIGHMPKDSYEKQTKLYPETLRKEYSKASKRLNLFTKFSNVVSGKDDADELRVELKEKLSEMDKLKDDMVMEMAIKKKDEILSGRQQEMLENMQRQINSLSEKMNNSGENQNGNSAVTTEFCCADCYVIHTEDQCPHCGSRKRRISESVQV
jgi:rubrerythrin